MTGPVPPAIAPSWTPDGAPLLRASPTDPPLDLRETDLRDGRFAGADLRDANLQHAILSGADLAGADLRGARLARADLSLARLEGADLRNADLQGADLAGANLRETRLDGADLQGANLEWADIAGTRGLPTALLMQRGANGRLPGQGSPGDAEEPAAGLRAYQRGRAAHEAGRPGLAERHYTTALAWVPESDAVRYALAAVAFERGDGERAETWLQAAVAVNPQADRARVGLALLSLGRDQPAEAAAMLQPAAARVAWLAPVLTALDRGKSAEALAMLREHAATEPACHWLDRPAATVRPASEDSTARLADPLWLAAERTDLESLLRQREQPVWLWHALIARALTIGAMDLAQRAEQRLARDAPEHRLWSLQLKLLDMTAQAFEALVRTRAANLGELVSLRWVALGAHGPTARIQCENGVFFAKRYFSAVRPAASVAFTHRTCRLAAERGLIVPVALPDRDGDDALSFAGDLLALYPDLGGQSIADTDIDAATATRVGAQLAELHLLLADTASGPGRPRGGIRIGTRVLRHPAPAQAWQAVLGQDPACAALFARHPLASRLHSLLDATARRLRAVVSGCTPGLVHGDFGAGNVLARPDGRLAVIDWDLCDLDLLVWDLARTADLMAVRWPSAPGLPPEIRTDIVGALLRGYQAVRPLPRAEQAALPLLIAASRVDLDASVLPICAALAPEVLEPILDRMFARLSRAAAGAPEFHAITLI